MKKTSHKRYFLCMLFLLFAFYVLSTSLIVAQNTTHTVEKGDTLWDICEKYYGDPDLWPKLWQMNPFVTNPHLLTPGDVLTLWEKESPMETVNTVIEKVKEEPVVVEPEPSVMGVNVGGLTDIKTLGYFSNTETETWGKIFASDTGKILFDQGDNAYVLFDSPKEINAGDQFSICKSSELIKHPITGEEAGYTLSILGKMIIEAPAGFLFEREKLIEKENVYKAKITEIYRPIYVGSVITAFNGTILPCVLPRSLDQDMLGNIVAAKDESQLFGPLSVVYINLGFNNGLNRGNLLEAVKENIAKNNKSITDADNPLILPDVSVGIILILETRPDSSTGLVIDAKEDFGIGTYVKNLSWVDAPEILKSIADCPIE